MPQNSSWVFSYVYAWKCQKLQISENKIIVLEKLRSKELYLKGVVALECIPHPFSHGKLVIISHTMSTESLSEICAMIVE